MGDKVQHRIIEQALIAADFMQTARGDCQAITVAWVRLRSGVAPRLRATV